MPRFRPAFCLTFLPGASTVPLAVAVMFLTRKSSMPTQPWFFGEVSGELVGEIQAAARGPGPHRSDGRDGPAQAARVLPAVVLLRPGDLPCLAALQTEQAFPL